VPLVLRNMEDRTQEELLAIARAGQGRVLLELDSVRERRSHYTGPYEGSRPNGGSASKRRGAGTLTPRLFKTTETT